MENENFFQRAREQAKQGFDTYAEALFSKPIIFLKKSEEKKPHEGLLVLFLAPELENDESRELLNKMIGAMKLDTNEYKLIGELKSELILDQLKELRPLVVITLGASAANLILQGQERLSKIHGNFFPIQIDDNYHTQVVPLFHPSFLLINPGMKKSAWMDMQKIMDFIGKSPT